MPELMNTKGLFGVKTLLDDAGWMKVLDDLSQGKGTVETESVLAAFEEAKGISASIAARIAKLAEHPLDQLVLAGLFVEGQDIGLRRRLRVKGSTVYQSENFEEDEDEDGGPARVLSAASLVEWLGGSSDEWRVQVAQRLLPQGGLAARRLIQRGSAATPLEGGVRLSPFLASLLYPGDGGDERRLDSSLLLSRPKEKLTSVVLRDHTKAELEAFLRLCRSKEGAGRAALLWGRAGTGKTMTAKAIAGELGLPLLQVRTMGAEREPFLLERAGAAALIEGAVLFFDECGRWVDSEIQKHGPPPEAAMLLQILQDHPGVILAAMNQGWLMMSEAFQRRFQVQILLGVPEPIEREELWRRHLQRPANAGDIAQVARRFPLSGGLIKNAAARLDSEAPLQAALLSDLERAAQAQLTLTLEWHGADSAGRMTMAELKSGLARETRRELAGLAYRIRRAMLLAVSGRESNSGYKACLWSPDRGPASILRQAAVYVARLARMKPLRETLDNLVEPDGQKRSKSAIDLGRSLSAAAMTGHLPILGVGNLPDVARPSDRAMALQDFLTFTGAGLLLTGTPQVLADKEQIGEWIRIRATGISDLGKSLRSRFKGVEFEVLERTVEDRLIAIGWGPITTVVRWAMARDSGSLGIPQRVGARSILAALDAYEKRPGSVPAFHA